jgi:hypothetical protein
MNNAARPEARAALFISLDSMREAVPIDFFAV